MLTSDLLVTRISKGRIVPVYAPLDQDNLEIARSVIEVFQQHMEKTYGELATELEGVEEINYRLIRGLAQILERRCIIETDSVIDPIAARRSVFEESKGFVADDGERNRVLHEAARKLSIDSVDLENALCADHEGNLIIKDFQPLAPETLLKQYNLSLAQTLLFRATGMEIQIEDNYQPVFRKIKQLGLMYSIEDGKITLEGSISLFKLTERYGSAFAKLLPTLMKSTKWSLRAGISRNTFRGKRILDFTIDHTHRPIFGIESDEPEVSFDSSIEADFYQHGFSGWTVKREPAVLRAGQFAFIPDFSLEHNGKTIYVEIIGFWTPEYLKHKIQKLNQLQKSESIILLVDRRLACTGSEFQADNVLFYDRKIPYLEIARILRKIEQEQQADEIKKICPMKISFDEGLGVINLDETAKNLGVSLEALKAVIRGKNMSNYSLVGDQLVSNSVLDVIRTQLDGVRLRHVALEIFKRNGIKAYDQALSLFGYKVKWSGLNPDEAEILRL
jgi:predicted nuclease of restriction endonuclease-like RecB superfamily